MYSYPLAEKFISINGEGPKSGTLSAFLRMRGCNLSCNYCDTAWANRSDSPCDKTSSQDILEWLKKSGVKNVTLTGGEPLSIPHIASLIELMGEAGFSVEVETNGSMPLQEFATLTHRPAFTLDYKCPDSGMERFMYMDNYSLLRAKDAVKFVVSSERDLDKAKEIIQTYDLTSRCNVFLSAVFGRIEPQAIVAYMTAHCWNHVHLQLQIHKFIWSPQQRGV